MSKALTGPSEQEALLERAETIERSVRVWSDEGNKSCADQVAQEVAIALVYNGISHAVMMASPSELEPFALGFSLTEGIINRAEDVYSINTVTRENGIEVALTICNRCFMQLKHRRRTLAGRSGCGICGAQSLDQVRLPVACNEHHFGISHSAIDRATAKLAAHQPLQAVSGAVHGAAWCDVNGTILTVCEDVGRHNALDKLVGALWPANEGLDNTLQQPGFLLISSRASYEILQKAAKAGIGMVVAVSAPTSLAIDIAQQTGITLIGFSRLHRHVTYTHAHRVIGSG